MAQVWPPPAASGGSSVEVFNKTEEDGNRIALAISYPQLLSTVEKSLDSIEKINRHLAQINDEENPL
jgi:hypothetical protein